jgi:hypothetical protein
VKTVSYDTYGEVAVLGARPDDIPLSQAVSQADLDALKAGDDDVLQLVARIGPGKGGRNWSYAPSALAQLVEHVQAHSLNGYLGHLTDEQIAHEFPLPAVHWIGAKLDGQDALVRGIVDRSSPDLKRWLRAKRVTQPSILTRPKLVKRGGQTVVESFDEILSIDLAPLGRAGMESARIEYAGEVRPPQNGSRDMDTAKLAEALNAPSDTAEDVLLRSVHALRERSETSLAGEIAAEAERQSIPSSLAGVIGEMVKPKLTPLSSQTDISRAVREAKSTDAYKAAVGDATTGRTINPPGARPGQTGDGMAAYFDLVSQPLSV